MELLQVLHDLVGLRPLLGRDDQEDVTAAEAVERVVGDAGRIHTGPSQVVRARRLRVLESSSVATVSQSARRGSPIEIAGS